MVSASQRPADQEDLPAPDFPAAAELQPDNMCSQQQLRSALGQAMKSLPERYQKLAERIRFTGSERFSWIYDREITLGSMVSTPDCSTGA